jgi:hypothetical protein
VSPLFVFPIFLSRRMTEDIMLHYCLRTLSIKPNIYVDCDQIHSRISKEFQRKLADLWIPGVLYIQFGTSHNLSCVAKFTATMYNLINYSGKLVSHKGFEWRREKMSFKSQASWTASHKWNLLQNWKVHIYSPVVSKSNVVWTC